MEVCFQKVESNQPLTNRIASRLAAGYFPHPTTIPEKDRSLERAVSFLMKKGLLNSSSEIIYGTDVVASYEFQGEDYNTTVFVYGSTKDLTDAYVYVIPSSPVNGTKWHILIDTTVAE